MKRATPVLLALCGLGAAVVLIASSAFASTLMTETFSYANGGLVAGSGGNWTTHSGTGTDIQVVSGHAAGDMVNAPDDNRTFAAQGATAKTFACFTVNIPSVVGTPSTNYFLHFKDTGTINFAARVFVVPSGTTFTFGLSTSTSSPTATWPTALNYGQTYVVAIDYDAAAGTSDLWVNPADETSPKITGAVGTTGFLLSALAMRESATITPAGSVLWKYNVDDVAVGTTFNDACAGQPTGTNSSTWGRVKVLYR